MEIFNQLVKWLEEGKKVALATVIQKKGSALRIVGSKMGVSSEMEMVGSVSGGCVEGAVVQEALKVMRSERIAVVDYGISDDEAWSVGLACGGQVKILLQPVIKKNKRGFNLKILKKILELKASDRTFCLLTGISERTKEDKAIMIDGKVFMPNTIPHWIDSALIEKLKFLERTEASEIIKTNSGEIFADFYFSKPRIIIIGAVHIAQSLVKMARICGFTTVVIDPRRAFASPDRFQDVDEILVMWPTEGLEKIKLNEGDFLLLLSHDDKLDLPALQMGINRKVRYIGMLSSLKTREKRYEQLRGDGYILDDLRKIHAPVGMDLGSHTPEEIALSILAEITAFRYGKVK